MLMLISPAKSLDMENSAPVEAFTQANLLGESEILIERAKALTPDAIASLMKISDKLAALNVARFAQWQPNFTLDNAKQAIFAFQGDVYQGLDAASLSQESIDYAQTHLRMLSGLYGLLRPLDLMMAYRLEMGTKLDNVRGSNLYQFWGNIITDEINRHLNKHKINTVVNLASDEYFKSVKTKGLNAQLITPVFKDQKNGNFKIISFYAKRARGLMARFLIENQVNTLEELIKFDIDGYFYCPEESSADKPVFKRLEIIK